MSSTLTQIVTGMQTFHAAITGVRTAPTAMPSQISAALFPLAVTFPGEATWHEQAIGMERQDREMIVRCYVAPVSTGAGVDDGFQDCLTLIQAFGTAYLADTTLGGIVENISEIRDLGLDGRLEWAGVLYRGFEFRLRVVNK
jgi:hypothetical protein